MKTATRAVFFVSISGQLPMGGSILTGSVQVVALFHKRAGNLFDPSPTGKNRHKGGFLCVDGRDRTSDLSFMSATL